jgi:amino-acid N-acetyltransferase
MKTEMKDCGCPEVRRARQTDLTQVVGMLERARLPVAGVAEAFSDFFVAQHEDKVVGVAGLELYGSSALLRSVVVDDRWRGSGVGRTLIDTALAEAKAHGVEDIFLLTTTAEHYFPRFGFDCVSRDSVRPEVQASLEFRGACPSSAVVMRRRLADRP